MRSTEVAIKCLQDEAQAILGLIPQLDEQFESVVHLILSCNGKVILTGVGKSGHIAAKIAATLSSTGTPSFFINPLDVFHGDLGVMTSDDVVIAISYSGQTDELLRFIPLLQERKIPIVGISSDDHSLLAKFSNYHLSIKVNEEACPLNLAPTSSTTATLALGDALACALMEARGFKASDFARFHPGGNLGQRLLLTASDVMRTDSLPIVCPDTLLGEAIVQMSAGKLGLCVVVKDGRILGILTDGDIRRATSKLRASFFNEKVSQVMSTSPVCVSPAMKVNEIIELMHERKIHAVLVVDENERMIGIVDSFCCKV